ncbi:hypothetical protein DWY99_06140 [[Clostridium] leptum]|uniref:Uncharacterized protein n=1 Tax=[Clostridium] leptum TaxID=1535 RepID=A0A412AY12_9FIRM|nr:hypothetical protein DWY99_06140 [[Clostridium] leptum]
MPCVFICICSQRRFVEKTDAVPPKQQNSASKPEVYFFLQKHNIEAAENFPEYKPLTGKLVSILS